MPFGDAFVTQYLGPAGNEYAINCPLSGTLTAGPDGAQQPGPGNAMFTVTGAYAIVSWGLTSGTYICTKATHAVGDAVVEGELLYVLSPLTKHH